MTERLCVTCPRLRPNHTPRHYDVPNVCGGCRAHMAEDLRALPEHYAQLPAVLEPARRGGQRVSGTPSRSLGVSLEPLNLLSPAGSSGNVHDPYGDQHGPLPALVVLDQWVSDWSDTRGQGEHLPAATVTSLTLWLAHRLEWACDHHPAIDDYAGEVSAMARTVALIARADRGRGEPVGRCPVLLRDDTRCGTTLRVDPYADVIACHRCGSSWHRRKSEYIKLKVRQDEAKGEAA